MPKWPDRYDAVIRAHCRFADVTHDIGPDESLTLLGVDSMELISMIVDLEETFAFEMPEEFMVPEVFGTPGALWAALAAHLNL
jgi:acyl carrier protein